MRLEGKGRTIWGEAPFFRAIFLKCPPQLKASLERKSRHQQEPQKKDKLLVKGRRG